MPKKPPADTKACSTCDSYKAIGLDCGECHLMPPQWVSDENGECGWARPAVAAESHPCRFWLQRLNS